MRNIVHDLFGRKPAPNKINSRRKGAENERNAAKMLEVWTGEPFARVPSSGGLRWKSANNAIGDLVCTNDQFEFGFSIETKHLKSALLHGKLKSNSIVYRIWEQSYQDCLRANPIGSKQPMLMVKTNGMAKTEYVVFVHKSIGQWLHTYVDCVSTNDKSTKEYDAVMGFYMRDLIEHVPYKALDRLSKICRFVLK